MEKVVFLFDLIVLGYVSRGYIKHVKKNCRALPVESIINKTTLESSLAVSVKGKHTYTVWLCNSAPRYTPNRNGYICSPKICTVMFIAALFLITNNRKLPKYPSIVE